jgi:hypothetical protein
MRGITALPALALAACAPTAAERGQMEMRADAAQASLDTALAGLTPGEPVSCLPVSARQNYQIEGYGSTILYKVSRGLVYRNDTTGGCDRIARGDILVTRQPTGRLCSGDIATTIDNVSRFQNGSCALGSFVPYRRP